MADILVLKTSADATMKRLFQELGEQEIDCLIQSSQIGKYRKEYPYVNFIDICREGFYDLPADVIEKIKLRKYPYLYITLTGTNAYNFENIVDLLCKLSFDTAFFYNCNRDKIQIPKEKVFSDAVCNIYIKLIGFLYKSRKEGAHVWNRWLYR